jgi:hypothetical protein
MRTSIAMRLALVSVALLGLAGCEKQQAMTGSTKKSDTKVWEASDNPWSLRDWKAGDKASWERQMAIRAQYQNDYSRADQ